MKILIYIGHPAQFYFCKNFVSILQKKGHEIKLLLKTKDILEQLVIENGFEYENIQVNVRKNNKISILKASLQRTIKVFKIAKKFRADILLGTDSSVAQAAFLLRKTSLTTLEDDYSVIKNLARLTYPFSSSIVVPSVCDVGKWTNKKIPYSGYMKLAYLHPNRFTPNQEIVAKYIQAKKYCIIRLAALTAHHDDGIKGLNKNLIKDLIRIIEEKGYSIFISSESKLDEDFEKYQLKIKQTDIHHIMAYSSLLISDSQSMTVEAAILGTPSIRFSDFVGEISVLEELEHRYNLTIGIRTNETNKLLSCTKALLNDENLKQTYQNCREKMLSEKIDVSAFFTWFIENYPESRKIMNENPDYQYNFK